MIAASDFAAALVGLRPPDAAAKSLKPRVQHNPAGIHLISAGRCPNKRRQLYRIEALDSSFIAFSSREPASALLENR
jgi:hypothetical protein